MPKLLVVFSTLRNAQSTCHIATYDKVAERAAGSRANHVLVKYDVNDDPAP
jgi:hypothetical protein